MDDHSGARRASTSASAAKYMAVEVWTQIPRPTRNPSSAIRPKYPRVGRDLVSSAPASASVKVPTSGHATEELGLYVSARRYQLGRDKKTSDASATRRPQYVETRWAWNNRNRAKTTMLSTRSAGTLGPASAMNSEASSASRLPRYSCP